MEMAMTMTTKSILASILAAALLWSQPVFPTATINRDPTTSIITAVVSTSLKNRLVCKYQPLPVSKSGPFTSLNVNCTVNGAPSAVYYLQFSHPFQQGLRGLTLQTNANAAMAITSVFIPMAVIPPGTATSRISYQIAANGVQSMGVF
jgi:hypothetical protein